ncbi:DUF3054 domain-containing protein [Frigoribacterium sp. ACAM 257]|uniref:DUF3054 domain-containing protein n=1 Tax=Frigoribacterium sp. ACAM 257 TaxID=2508998 RepID=UPI001CB89982|nr:DUF3054 domain-containing protein [Frigoribacterium sp. ACAM 257]
MTVRRAPWWAFVADLVLVVAFVLIGRRSHDEGSALAGVLTTLWPFAAGLVVGWALVLVRGRALPAFGSGLVVWPATVVVGMVLRVVGGQGTAVSFVVVTVVVLGVFLLGWRTLARLARRRARGSRR